MVSSQECEKDYLMKLLFYAIFLVTALAHNSCYAATGDLMHNESSISGHDVLIIEAAMPEFNKHIKDIDQYNISILHNEASVTVIFLHTDRPVGAKGGPGLEVEMDKKTLQIIKSHFVR